MPKNHRSYSIMIQLLIDNELTSEEQEDLNTHLTDCVICEQHLEDAKMLSERVRRAKPHIQLPPDLRERVLNYIAAYGSKQTKSGQMESGEAVPALLH